MGIEQNKQLIVTYFERVNRGDKQPILGCLTEDFVFQGMGRHPDWMRYSWDRERFADAPRDMSTKMKSPIQLKLLGMIAEGDRVAVQAESYCQMANGKIYDNAYHFVFTVREGKICEVLEYCCTYTVFEVFGEYYAAAQ
jgi:ketosteroid isomerase-like protein